MSRLLSTCNHCESQFNCPDFVPPRRSWGGKQCLHFRDDGTEHCDKLKCTSTVEASPAPGLEEFN